MRKKKKEVESCEQLEHENDDRTQNVNKKIELWKNSNYINTTPVSFNSDQKLDMKYILNTEKKFRFHVRYLFKQSGSKRRGKSLIDEDKEKIPRRKTIK